MSGLDPTTYAGPVIATDYGYLGGKRRDPGEVFHVRAGQFSARWMEPASPAAAPPSAPAKTAGRSPEEQADYDRGLALGKTGATTVAEEDAKNAAFAAGYAVGIKEAEGGGDKPVDIPVDWNKLHHMKRIALAKDISGVEVTTAAEADAIIQAEAEERHAKAMRLMPGS